jgi:UPF0755 protein
MSDESPPQVPASVAEVPLREHLLYYFHVFLQLSGLAFLLLLIGTLTLWCGFQWWAGHDARSNPPAAPVVFVVNKGDALSGIAARLERAKLVSSSYLTYALALCEGLDRNLQPGQYSIVPGTSPKLVLQMMSKIRPGEKMERVVLLEGWTVEQFANRLVAKKIIGKKDLFIQLCNDPGFMKEIGVPADRAQGFLFPDTYDFSAPTDEKAVIRRLVARQREVVQDLKLLPGVNSPNAQPLTYAESLVLASILERECHEQEMPMVASVFHNRLHAGMRLESCATVRFALNKPSAALTMEDLRSTSPFNTYMQKGLPPEPICNPGKAAIKAAFLPEKSDYLFFVYKGDGHHYFSRTAKEHEQAREQYKSTWGVSAKPKAQEE